MTFLDPVSLALLLLLLVVGLAYLLRMPRRRIRVPDVMVARLALTDTTRINRQRRTLISLAIQVFILLLLVLAAALPYIGDALRGDRAIVVILDVSASMTAVDPEGDHPSETRFARARKALYGLVRGMRGGDRMMLMTVGRTVDVTFNFQSDPELIKRAISLVEPTAEEADFADACRLAVSVAESQPSAEIVLVTDAAARAEDFAPLKELGPEVLKMISVGAKSANVGITNFRIRRNLDSPTDYEVLVAVLNASEEDREVTVELSLDGNCFDSASLEVAAGSTAVQVFPEKLRVGGVLQATLDVEDAQAADNVAWEILEPPKRLRVLLVSEDTNESSFLVRAVGSNAGALEGMVMTPEQYRKLIAPDATRLRGQRDAVIFDRWIPEKPGELPPTHVLAIDCVPPGMPVTAGESFDKPLIRKWEKGHPLMSYLNLRNVFITSARRLTVLEPAEGEPPVERVADMVTSPLVLSWEREMPDGDRGETTTDNRRVRSRPQRFVVLGFDPRKSDIVLRKELPLLLWNSFLWFQKGTQTPTQVSPGGTFTLDCSHDPDVETVTVVNPAGEEESIDVDPETGVASFGGTSTGGVYRVRTGKKTSAFTVNVGAAFESDVRPSGDLGLNAELLDIEELSGIFAGGTRLWPWLLVLAAMVLAVEAVLFHRRIYF